MNALQDRVTIITGASSGIGRACALLFAREGAKLVLAARNRPALDTLVAEIERAGGRAIARAGDVSDEAFQRALVASARDHFGGLDVALNNAATFGPMTATPEVALTDWEQTLRVNLTGAFLAAKHQIPAMLARGAGSLVFTSSFVGSTAAFPQLAAYAASKAGLLGLTRALAVEFGARDVRVNALLPGGTDTPMSAQFANTPEALAHVRGMHALQRIAHPDEIARSALYLASDASSFTTGSALLADGGVSIFRA